MRTLEPFKYDSIIIINAAKGKGDEDRADSETIVQLLLLRKIFQESGHPNIQTKLATEVLNSENLELASKVGVKMIPEKNAVFKIEAKDTFVVFADDET